MYYVYILVSLKEPERIYIGRTTDLQKRLAEHNRGENQFSKNFMPWKLETYIVFSREELASAFEKYLKKGSGFAFMKKRLIPLLK